jgi:hypothetical protein
MRIPRKSFVILGAIGFGSLMALRDHFSNIPMRALIAAVAFILIAFIISNRKE